MLIHCNQFGSFYKAFCWALPLTEELFTIDRCWNSALGSQPLGLLSFTRVFRISASVRINNAFCTAHALSGKIDHAMFRVRAGAHKFNYKTRPKFMRPKCQIFNISMWSLSAYPILVFNNDSWKETWKDCFVDLKILIHFHLFTQTHH